MLKSSEFRKGREAGWRELEGLIARVERRGVRSLSLDELQRLPILYRAALSSLSVARTIALDRNLLLYLENLALRAFLAVYGPRVRPLEGLAAFFGRELPAAVRSARWHILIAAIALLVGTAGGVHAHRPGRSLVLLARAGRARRRPRARRARAPIS